MRALAIAMVLLTGALGAPSSVPAQGCGGTHEVGPNESISDVARRYYGDARKWTAIYYANQSALDNDPSRIRPGTRLRIPCLDDASAPDPTPLQRREAEAELKLLTGNDYKPFTDKGLPGGGLITELVNAAFEESPSPVSFSLTWEDDWSRHLFPLLDSKQYDVGFPWLEPDCRSNPGNERCRFHFSDPLFEMLVLVFVNADSGLTFAQDSDLHGKRLCRPAGYYTHDLDRPGRRWLTEGLVELVPADSPADCFRRLRRGDVDAVTVNEFLGRMTLHELGLEGEVVSLERPLSIEGLHVVISKTHARGTTFLYRFNEGLRRLKRSQRYEGIVSRHLSNFWQTIGEGQASPPPGPASAEAHEGPVQEERPAPAPPAQGPEKKAKPDESDAALVCTHLVRSAQFLKDKEYKKALPHLQAATRAELPLAEHWLGEMHFYGHGVPKNQARGVELLKRAAADGRGAAAYVVMHAYATGKGVEESVKEMLFWLMLSDLLLDDDHKLRPNVDKMMAAIREKATPEQIDNERRVAREWRQRNASEYPDCKAILAGGGDGKSADPGGPKAEGKAAKPESSGSGTGFYVSRRGHVLTNHHVVDGCKRVVVQSLGDVPADAAVVKTSEEDDLALLKTEAAHDGPIAHFRTHEDVSLGEPIFVFGFPLAGLITTSGNLTNGIVSAYEGTKNNSGQYQITAPIQPGNSGGPVVDEDGHVVAVVVSKLNEKKMIEAIGTSVQNVNFAVKGAIARSFLRASGVDVRGSNEAGLQGGGQGAAVARKIATRISCFK